MKNILIKQYTKSHIAVSYEDGEKCQEDIFNCLDQGEKIALDFSGIDYVIAAFLNPVIGDLILQRGNEVMKYIGIKNANESIIEKIKLVRDGALAKKEGVCE